MVRYKQRKFFEAFSILELLVTIAIFMILSVLVFPLAINKTQESKLESYASQIVTDIYYQQQLCTRRNFAGGVSLGSNTYTLFYGDSFSTSTDTDIKRFPNNVYITSITLTNSNEIRFASSEFKPLSYGTFILTDGMNAIQIYINREGLVGYEKL